jgi:hypothetical protein
MAVCWVVVPFSLVGPCCLHHQGDRPDDGDSKDLWNVGKLLPDYTALQPGRQPSSYSPPWEPQILLNKNQALGQCIVSNCRKVLETQWGPKIKIKFSLFQTWGTQGGPHSFQCRHFESEGAAVCFPEPPVIFTVLTQYYTHSASF